MALVATILLALVGNAESLLKANIDNIGRMNFTELCKAFQQSCTQHEVVTEDGYILTAHRLRGNGSRPVLLWHGFSDSSDVFLLRGLSSTSVALAAAGFDVWLGNSRGNRYSRRHKHLDPDKDKKQFWDFSFHEIAVHDMPATIDYILMKTGHKKLPTIGYSQGTTIFYVLGSVKPVYNKLVHPFISMTPIAFFTNLKQVLTVIGPYWPKVSKALKLFDIYELFNEKSALTNLLRTICTQKPYGTRLCREGLLTPIAGKDSGEVEFDFYKVLLGHFPTSTSIKLLTHFAQIYLRNRFANFDYGPARNLIEYGKSSPPDYDLGRVNTSVALLCGVNDRLSTLEDVELLRRKLPNVVHHEVLELNHVEFGWGKNINLILNPLLIKLLNQYT